MRKLIVFIIIILLGCSPSYHGNTESNIQQIEWAQVSTPPNWNGECYKAQIGDYFSIWCEGVMISH